MKHLAAFLVVWFLAQKVVVSEPEHHSTSRPWPTSKAPRYWPKYGGDRHVELLDGLWNTGNIGSIQDPSHLDQFNAMDPNLDPSWIETPNVTAVPSCVDNTPPGYLGYRGVTFFRRWFEYNLTHAGARIQFQACSFYCRIWINGHEIGDHRAGGYVAFSLDVPQYREIIDGQSIIHNNTNEIFVLVDNRFNKTTAPLHLGGDFWHYGGIMRSVEWHAAPPVKEFNQPVWPWRLYALPTSLSTVNLTVHVLAPPSGIDASQLTILRDIALSFDGGPPSLHSGAVMAQENDSEIEETGTNALVVHLGVVDVPHPRIWSTVDPQLHMVQVKFNGASVTERFGLRLFDTDTATGHITLNGEVIKLVGWNHHTQWPLTAASPTDEQLDEDMMLLRQGGANFVRGAHYPQDPRWLDRLDESGMIMWCETVGPAVSVEDTLDATFLKFQAQQVNEMLDNALNHASVAIWGFFNEGPSDFIEACPAYEASAAILKARDPTRFVTWASSKGLKDKCYASATLIAINAYPGWYQTEEPKPYWDHTANSLKAGLIPEAIGKPFVVSETGAGGIYEWSKNATSVIWTLEYQAKVIAEDVDTAIGNPNISGISLWHFFDFKTNDATENNTHCNYIPDVYPPICAYINATASDLTGRPGGLNHKGVVDFWRRLKPSYHIVAEKYNATKKKPLQKQPLLPMSTSPLRAQAEQ